MWNKTLNALPAQPHPLGGVEPVAVPNHQPVFDVFASDHPENYLETLAK